MTTSADPVRTDASPDPPLSRALWSVKSVLVLPRHVVLALGRVIAARSVLRAVLQLLSAVVIGPAPMAKTAATA